MIPNIFVSSTIEDLLHLRDGVRDTIAELAYSPILSEHGGVGYLPTTSAEDSCYITMRQCQIAVVIIGRRYGSLSANGLSVTHNEFRTARAQNVPVFTLVDRDVLAFKRVFDANSAGVTPVFPGMDHPSKSFAFIQEIMDSPINNGILSYSSASDARDTLKTQLAHFVGELLRRSTDPVVSDVRDVLAEIKTLRHELGQPSAQADLFLRAVRLLLEDRFERYFSLLDALFPSIDRAIPIVVESSSFDDVVEKATGRKPQVSRLSREFDSDEDRPLRHKSVFLTDAVNTTASGEEPERVLIYGITRDDVLLMTEPALSYFRARHASFIRSLRGRTNSRKA